MERSKHIRLHVHHVASFVAHYHARMLHTPDTFMEVLCGMCYCNVCMCKRGMVRSSLKDEQECGVKDQMGWAGKGSNESGRWSNRNGRMRGRGSDEETNGKGWQMVTFNNGDGEVAMSWIMANQNKGCFQKDVLLEACALAGNMQADTCTYTQKHIHMYTGTCPQICIQSRAVTYLNISTLHTQKNIYHKKYHIRWHYDIHDMRHKMI